jgi:hypothetical protein
MPAPSRDQQPDLPAVPDTPLAQAAVALVWSSTPGWVPEHSRRTYLFGAAALRRIGCAADLELLYVASMLHDVALGGRLDDGLTPFQKLSAETARRLALAHGASERNGDLVHDAVALHLDLASARDPRPEVAGVHLGAAADLLGLGLDQVPPALVERILELHPRRDQTRQVLATLTAEAAAKPRSELAVLVRDKTARPDQAVLVPSSSGVTPAVRV